MWGILDERYFVVCEIDYMQFYAEGGGGLPGGRGTEEWGFEHDALDVCTSALQDANSQLAVQSSA